MSELDPKLIKDIVISTIREFMTEINRGQSSTEIEKSASGKISFKVKVYGDNPYDNTNKARRLAADMAREHGIEGYPAVEGDFTDPTAGEIDICDDSSEIF